jgi:hypothetical protein
MYHLAQQRRSHTSILSPHGADLDISKMVICETRPRNQGHNSWSLLHHFTVSCEYPAHDQCFGTGLGIKTRSLWTITSLEGICQSHSGDPIHITGSHSHLCCGMAPHTPLMLTPILRIRPPDRTPVHHPSKNRLEATARLGEVVATPSQKMPDTVMFFQPVFLRRIHWFKVRHASYRHTFAIKASEISQILSPGPAVRLTSTGVPYWYDPDLGVQEYCKLRKHETAIQSLRVRVSILV